MSDVFAKSKRSEVMAAIRSKGNKETELAFAAILRKSGVKGWRRHPLLPGNPDFIFRKKRIAIFVDGCFWHCCPKHGKSPESNRAYWNPKLSRNRRRDLEITRKLRKLGWQVLRLWEHDLHDARRVVRKVRQALCENRVELQRSRRSAQTLK